MPIVVMKLGVNWSSQNRRSRQDLPTPESPIRRSLMRRSYVRVVAMAKVVVVCLMACDLWFDASVAASVAASADVSVDASVDYYLC